MQLIDLPGSYGLNTKSLDQSIVFDLLLNKNNKDFPDLVVIISDVENLKRNLLLFTQIKDLEIPSILAINMSDQLKLKGIEIDIKQLEQKLDTKIVLISAKKNEGFEELKNVITNYRNLSNKPIFNIKEIDPEYFTNLNQTFPEQSLYKLWLLINQDINFSKIQRNTIETSGNFKTQTESYLKKLQQKETIKRYQWINNLLKENYSRDIAKGHGIEINWIEFYFISFGGMLLSI